MTNQSPTHSKQIQLLIVSKEQIAKNIYEFEFQEFSGNQLPSWDPGAHINLHIQNNLSRPYSLMRGRLNFQNWRIAVLLEEEGRGGSIALIEHLHVGSRIFSDFPRNNFKLIDSNSYLFIAGGIGITPIISMIETAEQNGAFWRLEYLGRSRGTMAYLEELENKYSTNVNVYSKEDGQGFFPNISLAKTTPNTEIFACGPQRLLADLEEIHAQSGRDNLHFESFHPKSPDQDIKNQGFMVYCSKSDQEIYVEDDESILMAADFAGIEISGDCLEGTCGVCETNVIEGVVDHRDSVLSKKQQLENSRMMICVSRGYTRLVLDL